MPNRSPWQRRRPDAAQVPCPLCNRRDSKRGTIDVLRHGIKHGAHDLDLFYGTPSEENEKAKDLVLFEQNRFTVTRQLKYSHDETGRGPRYGALHQRPAGLHLRA